jgi:hypothetical protein
MLEAPFRMTSTRARRTTDGELRGNSEGTTARLGFAVRLWQDPICASAIQDEAIDARS